jgi:hypothetical protein
MGQKICNILLFPIILATVLETRIFYDVDVFVPRDTQSAGAIQKLSSADLAQADGVACGQADDLDLVAVRRRDECKECGSEEHGFIVWVADEEDDSFVAEFRRRRKGRGEQCRDEEAGDEQHNNKDSDRVQGHGDREV